jgi:hypothetical protein
VEPGALEPKARLLAESIRRWGAVAGARIFAYQPRGGGALTADTQLCFQRLGVEYRVGYFNKDDAENPWANKIHACAHLEKSVPCETVVFLDTDTVLLSTPKELMLDSAKDLAVRPVVKKHAGTTGRRSDRNDAWWNRLYEAANVAAPPFVYTVDDEVRIRGYYNGGLVAFRPGFGERWVRMARLAKPMIPRERYYNLDQISLALAAAAIPGRITHLPPSYNYPIARRAALPGSPIALHNLVHVHYHNAFNATGFIESAKPNFDSSDERFRWLQSRLPLEPVIPLSQLKIYRRAPIKKLLKKLWDRMRLDIGDVVYSLPVLRRK